MNLDADAVRRLARPSEAEFTRQVIAFARLYGWRVAHFRPAVNRRGQWSTPVQGDGKGFLDLVLVRERVIFAELKADNGKLTSDQQTWLERLEQAGQEVYVWRPMYWEGIEATLKG